MRRQPRPHESPQVTARPLIQPAGEPTAPADTTRSQLLNSQSGSLGPSPASTASELSDTDDPPGLSRRLTWLARIRSSDFLGIGCLSPEVIEGFLHLGHQFVIHFVVGRRGELAEL